MNAIEVKNVTKTFPGFSLDDLSFSLPRGSIMGLVGENGAGKTTTIKLIMNAIRKDKGLIKVLDVENDTPEFRNIKELIGVVLDEAYFPEVLTPKNVNEIMKCTYLNWDETAYNSYLKHFKLPEAKLFKNFSRGMKMKLALAVAMSHHAQLLVLDEATSGLDPIARDEMLDIFNDFTRDENHSILISSHIVSDLEKICDYIAFIRDGKLLFCEEKDKLIEEYGVLKLAKVDFNELEPDIVIGSKCSKYGVEALVKKGRLPKKYSTEYTTLEDIILFFAKGGKNQ